MECLVLSKLDYAAAVFYPLPLYQLKRLQCVQNACTGFVLGWYTNENDLHTLNWLLMSKRRDFIVLKLVYKVLHDKNWPSYLALEKCEVGKYNLRSMGTTTLKVPWVGGTFQKFQLSFLINCHQKLEKHMILMHIADWSKHTYCIL